MPLAGAELTTVLLPCPQHLTDRCVLFLTCQLVPRHTVWGGQLLTKTYFFLMYRPSCLIEASSRPEKYLLMCVGLLANHLFSSNLIFLSGSFFAVTE